MDSRLLAAAACLVLLPAAVAPASAGPVADGGLLDPVCAERYEDGVITTWPCPPELCTHQQAVLFFFANGTPGSPAAAGVLTCHDATHATAWTLTTLEGEFDERGHKYQFSVHVLDDPNVLVVRPPLMGYHAHCNLGSLESTDYAFVRCGKA